VGDALLAGDICLSGYLTGFKEVLPLNRFTKEFDHPGCPGLLGRFADTLPRKDDAYNLVRGCPSPQGPDVAIFERPLGPEVDFNHLFAVGRHRGATVASLGKMDDSEPDLRLYDLGAGSQSVTDGEPDVTVFEATGIW